MLPAFASGQTVFRDALPDAPSPFIAQSTPVQQPAGSGSSSSVTPAAGQSAQQPSSDEELKQEEKQRILGVVPNFNTVYGQDAPPLTAKQKFQLDMKSSLDPFTFAAAALDAGLNEAEDQFTEYGWGAQGYGKRFAASYADTFDGGLWGNAILPIWWHEDPRYFRMGSGSFLRRALYSAATTVWCKRDNGSWGPNYANVAGNFVAGGISNLYYPSSDRGFGLTMEGALTVTAEGTIGAEFVEFWPDVSRRLFHKKDKPPARANGGATQGDPQPQ